MIDELINLKKEKYIIIDEPKSNKILNLSIISNSNIYFMVIIAIFIQIWLYIVIMTDFNAFWNKEPILSILFIPLLISILFNVIQLYFETKDEFR